METSPLRPRDERPGCATRRGALLRLGGVVLAGCPAASFAGPQLSVAPASAASSAPAPKLVLRSAAQAGAPVKYAGADAAHPGLCAEIVGALQRVDPTLRIEGLDQMVPLRRLELMLSTGEIDVFLCMLQSGRRQQMMRFLPVPLYRVRHVVAQRADDPRVIQTWDELRALARRKPLVVVQGTQLALTLAQADVAFTESARSDRDALQMLLRGRTDVVYGQDLSLRQALRGTPMELQVRLSARAFEEDLQYAAVSRALPEATVDRLVDRLRQLSASGELARIAERYR